VVGVINGIFVEVIGVSSFITTLGMLLGLGGLTLIISTPSRSRCRAPT
jgi:simple sugar transport system permease protein